MSEMVERVAKALHHAECWPFREETRYGTVWGWGDVMPAVRERHLNAARAAMEAMRKPTAEVVQAGMYAASWYSHTKLVAEEMADPVEQLEAVFAAMIDAALSEHLEG